MRRVKLRGSGRGDQVNRDVRGSFVLGMATTQPSLEASISFTEIANGSSLDLDLGDRKWNLNLPDERVLRSKRPSSP